jgi:hypothetical protein
VLRAARIAGLGLIRAIRRPGINGAPRVHEEVEVIDALEELVGEP